MLLELSLPYLLYKTKKHTIAIMHHFRFFLHDIPNLCFEEIPNSHTCYTMQLLEGPVVLIVSYIALQHMN